MVKRLCHAVLIALVMQLTGIAGICAPARTSAEHDCCTPSEQNHPRTPQRAVPECCLVTAIQERRSTSQTQSTSEDVTPKLQLTDRVSAQPPVYRPFGIYHQNVTHPVSPPISPLRQSCLLLI